MKVLSTGGDSLEHPTDRQYQSLHCLMEPLDRDHAHFKVIVPSSCTRPPAVTTPPTLRWWRPICSRRTGTLTASTPCPCWTCLRWRGREKGRGSGTLATGGSHVTSCHFPLAQGTSPSPHRMLLWHGSRLTNWVGILSQGLRIAPPEAPVTGYMVSHTPHSVGGMLSLLPLTPLPLPYHQFGKGVYFADMCSKSANYCFATKRNKDGVLLLCDVSHTDRAYAKGGAERSMVDHCRLPLAPPTTCWPLTTTPTNCPLANTALVDWAELTPTPPSNTPCEHSTQQG